MGRMTEAYIREKWGKSIEELGEKEKKTADRIESDAQSAFRNLKWFDSKDEAAIYVLADDDSAEDLLVAPEGIGESNYCIAGNDIDSEKLVNFASFKTAEWCKKIFPSGACGYAMEKGLPLGKKTEWAKNFYNNVEDAEFKELYESWKEKCAQNGYDVKT